MSDARPLVSIIIPCFNGEAFVADAIRSALSQEHGDVEIIVIDDGSSDGSLEVIRSFGNRVRWETGPNRGGGAARNRGLELSRGEFIQFLDADDLLHPEKVSKGLELLESNQDAFVTCGWRTTEMGSDRTLSESTPELSVGDPIEYSLRFQIQTATVLHHRAHLVNCGGFDENLPCAQERDLHLRMTCAGLRMLSVPDVLVTVRRCPNSVSSDVVRVLDQHERIFTRAYHQAEKNGLVTDSRRRAFARAFAVDARQYITRFEIEKGRHYFELARKLDPGGIKDAFKGRSRLLLGLFGPVTAQRLTRAKRSIV